MENLARAIVAGTVLVLLAGLAAGAPRAATDPIAFSIDSSPLPDALNAWAQQAGLQLIWPADERAAQFKTQRVAGSLSPESALQQLLLGTGLTYSFVDDRTVAIRRDATAAARNESAKSATSAPLAGRPRRANEQPEPGERVATVAPASAEPVKEVVVTGSHIRGGNASSPVFTVERADIERTGYTTVPQLVQSFPQNFNNISDTTFGTVNGGDQGSLGNGFALNLRGLGGAATLVLLNGRRLVPSGDGSFVDLSLIPYSAVERVDVLTDGASAIYGSDAIGGVVNVVLRERFDKAETLAAYNTVTRGDGTFLLIGQTLGTTSERGSALLSYEYFQRTPLQAADRAFTRDVSGVLDLWPKHERHGVVAALTRRVAPGLQLFSDFLYGRRESHQVYTVFGPSSRQSAAIDQLNGVLGANIDLAAGWQVRASGTFGSSATSQRTLADGARVSSYEYASRARSADLTADGPIASVGGGAMRLAAGVQWRDEEFAPDVLGNAGASNQLQRQIGVGYAELLVPLVGAGNRRSGIESLELSAAGRFEHFSDFGSTADPKFGLSWSPAAGVNLRGTYGTSFKAPLLSQINPGNALPAAFDLPDANAPTGMTPAIVLFGSGVDLKPEQATTWTAGLDVSLDLLPGFAASLTYFNIRFKDRIAAPVPDDDSLFMALSEPLYTPFIDFAPNGDTTDAWFSNPRFLNFSSATSAEQVSAIVDDRLVNLVRQHLEGIDALLTYRRATAHGEWSVQLSGNYLLDGGRTVLPGAAAVDTLNTVFNPVDLRLRNSVSWTQGALTATAAMNYADSYRDDRPAAGDRRTVASWTTFDCTLQYQAGAASSASQWRDTDVILSALNVFDRDPPFIASDIHLHFDGANANPSGRVVGILVRKRW